MKHLLENIKRIKSIMNLSENKQTYPYGCVMLYFNDSNISNIHAEINSEDLYTEGEGYGIESEPHCTLLYGLHDDKVELKEIQKVLDNNTFNTCRAYNLSFFENPKYDVLKYDIQGISLHKTNEELKQFPYTSEFPNYHPHMTIAYLKPGKAKEYIGKLSDEYKEMYLTPQYAVYSDSKGGKNIIPIKVV